MSMTDPFKYLKEQEALLRAEKISLEELDDILDEQTDDEGCWYEDLERRYRNGD